jgi:hypothetical protein
VTTAGELIAQLSEVEYLAIEADHEAAVAALHRLVAQRAEIDDGQPAVTKSDGTFHPQTGVIRTAVAEGIAHRLELRMRLRCFRWLTPPYAGDTTHDSAREK